MHMLFFILLAVIAGAVLPVQAAVNSRLGDAVNDSIYGTFLSFIVGLVALMPYVFSGKVKLSSLNNAFDQHWSIWTGGALGAFYVTSLIILTPRLGVAMTLGLTVAGQMAFALVMDHFGWLGLHVDPINWTKVIGIVLIVGGVWLLRAQ
ncbi:MAG: DMT family transporter [Bacteroidetes bacterium]|nr:MAG: DMT family transporter [Bacteroidota bacterium]